jgi:hypothetical protein
LGVASLAVYVSSLTLRVMIARRASGGEEGDDWGFLLMVEGMGTNIT